ncbi:MAG: metallophosphoesterase family protein [Deltaproteobacteria bacterium]|nr:metallophosphoesterase family protein [Deltaproteobacteria bacterium]
MMKPATSYRGEAGGRCQLLAAAAALLAVLAVAASAPAAPKFVRLAFTESAHDSMSVAWTTDADTQSEVQYGTSPGNYPDKKSGKSFKANGGLGFVHEVVLGGLKPATTYYYRAGDPADGFSGEYTLATGPAPDESCGKFRFVFFGDNRPDPIFGGGEFYDVILGQAAAHKPAFVVNGGDLVVSGDKIDQWLTYLGYNDDVAPLLPNMPCLGNHDTGPGEGDGANYNQIFALPRSSGPQGSGTEDYYHFRYGNAVFVALSTEGFKGGDQPFGKQAAYLDEVLAQSPARWKIVFLHKPIYTYKDPFGVTHGPNEEGQNAALVAVFDKHHVDVVLTSHNHWYERYTPSACGAQGNPGSDKPCAVGGDPAKGTLYIVSGGAGAFTIPALLCGLSFGQDKCSGSHHYLVFDVADEKLTMDAWAAHPQKNEVIDSFTIVKPKVDCSPLPPGDGGAGAAGGGPGGSGPGPGGAGPGGAGTGATGVGAAAAAPGQGGAGASAGTGKGAAPSAEADAGCGCRAPRGGAGGASGAALALGLALLCRRRRDVL